MDEFDKNVTFAIAMRNVARAINKMLDGLDGMGENADGEDQSLLLEYEAVICHSIIEFLEEFLPRACADNPEDDDDEEM